MAKKINEFQAAWAENVGLDLRLDLREDPKTKDGWPITIRHEGDLLGKGATVLSAVLDAFNQRRKQAETLQTELCILAGLGKNPDETLTALDEMFPEDEEGDAEGDEEEEDDEIQVRRR